MRTAEAMAAALALLCVAATRLQSPKGSETLPAAPKRLRIVKPLALPPLPSAPRVAPRLVVIPPGIKTNHLYFWWSDHTDYDKRHVFGTNATTRLYTNNTVLQGRLLTSPVWINIVTTTATNYTYESTNANMAFRLTAIWQ
jgi:hypothetical protein